MKGNPALYKVFVPTRRSGLSSFNTSFLEPTRVCLPNGISRSVQTLLHSLNPYPERYFDQFSHFCGAHVTICYGDSNRPHLCTACMRCGLKRCEKIDIHTPMKLWTLEKRRNRQDLIEAFKMCNGLSRLKLNERHSRKLVKYRCTRDCCIFFKQSDWLIDGISWTRGW